MYVSEYRHPFFPSVAWWRGVKFIHKVCICSWFVWCVRGLRIKALCGKCVSVHLLFVWCLPEGLYLPTRRFSCGLALSRPPSPLLPHRCLLLVLLSSRVLQPGDRLVYMLLPGRTFLNCSVRGGILRTAMVIDRRAGITVPLLTCQLPHPPNPLSLSHPLYSALGLTMW